MKAIFKLKKERYGRVYLTNEHAETIYKNYGSGFYVGMPVRISMGFFSYKLSFGEWVDHYKIVIL